MTKLLITFVIVKGQNLRYYHYSLLVI